MADVVERMNRLPERPALATSRSRPVPKKVRTACDAIVSGHAKTVTDAAAHAGISREYLSRQLSKPHVAEYLRQKAARTVAIASGRASARIGELIDASSEHVSFDASRHVLAIAGIKPAADPNVSLNIELKAGWVIDLREDDERGKIVDADPQQIGAADH